MPKPPEHVSLRVNISTEMYGRISDYRHTARHDSKNQAVTCLINAGLAALAKPAVALRPFDPAEPPNLLATKQYTPGEGRKYSGPAKPAANGKRLIPYAGAERRS